MILKCMRPTCKRTLVQVEGVTQGTVTLICPKCTGRSVYTFRPESCLQPPGKFHEKAREGASQSDLTRTDLRAAPPACAVEETPQTAPPAPAQSRLARVERSAV